MEHRWGHRRSTDVAVRRAKIELERQNGEPRRVNEELTVAHARYFELYETLPLGTARSAEVSTLGGARNCRDCASKGRLGPAALRKQCVAAARSSPERVRARYSMQPRRGWGD